MSIRTTLTALSMTVAALASTASASANTTQNHWGEGAIQGVTSVKTRGENALTATASGQRLPSTTPGLVTIAFQCQASANGSVASATGSDACYLLGGIDGEIYRAPSTGEKPGAGDTRVTAAINVPDQPYAVCQEAHSVFADSSFLDLGQCTHPIEG